MTRDLIAKDKANIWHPFTPVRSGWENLLVSSAKGAYLTLEDGRQIFDAISSWWVNLHGHSHPKIANAIADQANKLEHVIFSGFTHEPAITLSENILSILPDNLSKVFYSDDGSTSVEVAIKMALQFWYNQGIKKSKIVAIDGAYHGDTFGAMAVGERGFFNQPFESLFFEVDYIDFPKPGNENVSLIQLEKIISQGETAAFIYEPLVQGAAGMRMYSPEILQKLLDTCKSQNVICIADEVLTGFGRTGKLFASDYIATPPDIICLSKGLTGGSLPLGATVCSQEIYDPFDNEDLNKTFFHGHSFTGNPIACAASNASFEILMKKNCREAIENISKIQSAFAQEISDHKNVKDARSTGTIMALEIATGGESGYWNKLRTVIYPFFLEKGVLIRPLGNIIYVLPPYVSTEKDLENTYSQIRLFLDTQIV